MANYYMNEVKNAISYTMNDNKYSQRLLNRLAGVKKADAITLKEIEEDLVSGNPGGSNYNAENSSRTQSMNIYDSLYHANNLRRSRNEIYNGYNKLFNQTFRFGLNNPFGQISTAREYIFFTKPDLHIFYTDDYGVVRKNELADGLESYFWVDMGTSKKRIIECLQGSYKESDSGIIDPFNHLLQNTVNNNLEVPALSAPSIETSANTFGVSLSYRGSSEESDDNPEFSLEFKDDKYLNVYTFFRAYEDYETLKKHGRIKPQRNYRLNKIIHDQFAIYKFIVDEDMETIIYWGKYYGVYPVSLPRDAFSSDNFSDGLTFSINFKAAFYEDMKPEILYDFNELSKDVFDRCKYDIDVYNEVLGRADGRTAKAAQVFRVNGDDPRALQHPNGYYYKLRWRGDDVV